MGNLIGTRTDATAHEKAAVLMIERQRSILIEKQETHARQAQRLLSTATLQKSSNNIPGAVASMRRYTQTVSQMNTISGIIHNLDAHTHALETKMITNETMAIMKQTAGTLSRNTMTAAFVDDTMLETEDAHEELRAISSAMSTHDNQSDTDLLNMLDTTTPVTAIVMPSSADNVSRPGQVNDDDDFYAYIRLEILNLTLPNPPADIPADKPVLPPPYALATMVV